MFKIMSKLSLSFIALFLFSTTAFAAVSTASLNGEWVNVKQPWAEKVIINNGIGHFESVCNPTHISSFYAKMVRNGNHLTFYAPITKKKGDFTKFKVNLVINKTGTRLTEVWPYPSGFGHGLPEWRVNGNQGCGFALSIYPRTMNGLVYKKK